MRSVSGPFGPYELGLKILFWRNTNNDEVQGTGHCDLVEDELGNWWAVCLGV